MRTATKKWTEWKSSIEKSGNAPCPNCNPQKGEKGGEWGSPVNILLVDDRRENLLSLEAVLDSPDYRLVSVQSGEEALRWVLKEEFALILLDVQMPGLNGFETANLIKQREKSRHIPIIFVTAISKANEHVEQGYAAGAIDYIFKPLHTGTLKIKVERFVQLYQKQKQIEYQSEMLQKRSAELLETNQKYFETLLELKKSEVLSRTIVETSIDTILTIDEEGRILSTNPVVQSMFGYHGDDVIGMPINKLVPLPAITSDWMLGKVIETSAIRQDQTVFPVDIQIARATVQQQHVFVCSIRDITERKRFELERKMYYQQLENLVEERTQELVLSQERFQKIFQSSPCLIAIRSCADQRYLDVNQSWLDHTGYTYAEVRNLSADRLLLAGESTSCGHPIDLGEALRNEKISYVTKTGAVREGLLSTEAIRIQGEPCMLSVITDITEQVFLEKEIARLDRLHLIGEMAAGIAHEIRNPMTTVRGFLQLAKNNRSDTAFHFIDIMLTELDRANTIITEFLTLAKNKTNDLQKQQLYKVIEPLLPLVQAEAALADKSVQTEIEPCPEIYLDEKEIRQLFLNLALNGLEAMSASGVLTVKIYGKNDEVVLEIVDQGCGIKEDMLEKIWTPFFTTKEKGTGLGLAVCYSIASRHNAKIAVATSSAGTAFSVTFAVPQEA